MIRRTNIRAYKKLRDLLSAIFTVCALDSTLSSSAFEKIIAESRLRAAKRVAVLKPTRRGTIEFDALGLVVYRWQRSPRYLDEDGLPLQIAARGPAPSIEALFREIKRSDYFELGLKHLSQVGRVKRSRRGLYSPCAEVSIFQTLSPEVAELLAQTVNRVVETVIHNTSLKDRTSIRLVERVTAIPDLHKKQIAAFKLFAREQGGTLINTMNDWLEGRRGENTPRRTSTADYITAGLHVFAFIEKNGS